ncbi:hypothetical protein VNI00_013682 [Paramarasmius palmivorus]|uniref:Mannose-P-dolichol utilization defect 1 protein homolog n=1 Tax=Paramarasmius palmivorus TaxID=297713 RepID=A0AAW0BWM2_9AGAR
MTSVSIVGEKCYTSLIENLNLSDIECIKYSISKGLGIGIVVGGSIMKVPQLLLILNSHSASGLSLPSYILETLAYAITLSYSYRNQFPFSTYGENLFLTIQNVIITLLIIVYTPSHPLRQKSTSSKSTQVITTALGMAVTGIALATVPLSTLSPLQLLTLPLSLSSKLPQIHQNYRARSTGQLSAFAVFSQILGCAARLFTSLGEVDDGGVLAAGFALALVLNVVLGVQVAVYWGQGVAVEKKEVIELQEREKPYTQDQPYATQTQTQTQTPYAQPAIHHRVATPPPQGGRKWARKVD